MTSYEMLLSQIRKVRRRWRFQILTRGIAILSASAAVLLAMGVWGADLFGFSPAAVWCIRVLTGGTVLFAGWYFLWLPLRIRISDVAVAQYIEEKYPRLEDRLVTAVEYGNRETLNAGMIRLLIQDALVKTSGVDISAFVNRKRLAAFGALGLAATGALLALLAWGPAFFPYGFSSVYAPWTDASLNSPMMIRVVPGDAEVAEGSDQLIDAQLVGFDSPEVRLYQRFGKSDKWNAVSMEPNPRGSTFRYLLVDIRNSQQYFVESKGVRSPVYSLEVFEQARVEKLDLTYNFPAYTGMPPQTVSDEGDISALKGTRMDLRGRLNIPVKNARLYFDDGATIDLGLTGTGEFAGSFVLERSGSYTVQVTESRGRSHAASPEYDIDAVEDQPPRIAVSRPMRDVRATSLEEVFTEIKGEDDIAIGKVELRYSVNGAPEKIVGLYGGNPPIRSITAAHTFFLEDFGLQPGDLISYYAKGWDGKNATEPAASSSDIYFIQVRPFQQDYRQSQQQSMPGSGGGGDEGQQALSRQQKEIISATFKLIRDKERMNSKEYLEDLESLSIVQGRLQAQAQGLADRLRRREAAQAGRNFQMLGEHLKAAIGEMEKAAADLRAQKPDQALPQEQKSLQQLMRAESLFNDIQVSFSARNSGGRGSRAAAEEDLADLFELELNKLKNQYETVQRAEQQEQDQEIDEALERLRKLAQRQQQLGERSRMEMRQGGSSSPSGSVGGQSQQQLLEQAEQLRRQLQRLSRERSSPQLNQAGNRLQKAIEEMKKALSNSRSRGGAEQKAQEERALQQLNEAVRELANTRESSIKDSLGRAVKDSEDLVKQQERIQQALDRLARETPQRDSPEESARRSADIVSSKNALADRLNNLETDVRDLSRQARKNNKGTSERLADAADTIRDRRLAERIQEGNLLIQNGFFEGQQRREDFIREGLTEVQKRLEDAESRLGKSENGRIEEAADRARQLSEGLESMQRRLDAIRRENGEGTAARAGAQKQGQRQGRGSRQDPSGQRAQNESGMPSEGRPDPQNPGSMSGRSPNALEVPGGGPGQLIPGQLIPGPYWGGQARQYYRELEQRLEDAQDLLRMMNRNPTQVENLRDVIDALKKSRDYADSGDLDQAALLKEAADKMREVESDLAGKLKSSELIDRYFVAGESETPENYRKLVEEYYKAIAGSK